MPCCSSCAQGNPCSTLSGPAGACGWAYANLVRAGGRTETDRFGMWCNVEDAQAWHSQAKNVLGMVQSSLRGAVLPEALSAQVEAFKKSFDDLPTPSQFMAFGMAGCSEAVAESVAFIERAGCILERIEGAGGEMDVVAPRQPGDTSGGGLGLGFGLTSGALLTLAVLFFISKAID